MLRRDRLDEPFVQYRVVAGAQRVGLVAEREFELARSEFGDRAFEREVLDVGRGVKRVEEGTEIFEFAQAINLDIARRAAAVAGTGGADAPVARAAGIAEIEFELDRPEERRVGKEGVSTCGSRWSLYHQKKRNI